MTSRPSSAAPILTIVAIVMLVLYLGSYLLLVWPDRLRYALLDSRWEVFPKYRHGTHWWAERLYWPLEQIDRRIRPEEWQGVVEP
jgi:hypothetical protein